MSFLRRMFSSDYRKAIKAEAAGDYLEAAKYFALAEKPEKVAEMHLARAERLADHSDNLPQPDIAQINIEEQQHKEQINSLRQCLRFAPEGSAAEIRAYQQLGTLYQNSSQAAGIGSERSHQFMVLAAENFAKAQRWKEAGDCYLTIGDNDKAAETFATGGLLDELEPLLAARELVQESDRRLRDAFKDYEFHFGAGQRSEAEADLHRCVEFATDKGDYRALLDRQRDRKLTRRRLRLKWDQDEGHFLGAPPLTLGRERTCAVVARGASVSRRHAILEFTEDRQLALRDNDSRNGTLLGGMPIANMITLAESAEVGLGESSSLRISIIRTSPLLLAIEVIAGLDVGSRSFASEKPFDLRDALPNAPALRLALEDAYPWVERLDSKEVFELNDQRVSGRIELLKGDVLKIGTFAVEVFE